VNDVLARGRLDSDFFNVVYFILRHVLPFFTSVESKIGNNQAVSMEDVKKKYGQLVSIRRRRIFSKNTCP
jgi:hypothetical protein